MTMLAPFLKRRGVRSVARDESSLWSAHPTCHTQHFPSYHPSRLLVALDKTNAQTDGVVKYPLGCRSHPGGRWRAKSRRGVLGTASNPTAFACNAVIQLTVLHLVDVGVCEAAECSASPRGAAAVDSDCPGPSAAARRRRGLADSRTPSRTNANDAKPQIVVIDCGPCIAARSAVSKRQEQATRRCQKRGQQRQPSAAVQHASMSSQDRRGGEGPAAAASAAAVRCAAPPA